MKYLGSSNWGQSKNSLVVFTYIAIIPKEFLL